MKWQVGTVEDLLALGVNKLTWYDWRQQVVGIFMALTRIFWVALIAVLACMDLLQTSLFWWVVIPTAFALGEGLMTLRIPHKDKWDIVLGFAIVPSEIFATVRSAWFLAAWAEVLRSKITGGRKDRWSLQYEAEGSQ